MGARAILGMMTRSCNLCAVFVMRTVSVHLDGWERTGRLRLCRLCTKTPSQMKGLLYSRNISSAREWLGTSGPWSTSHLHNLNTITANLYHVPCIVAALPSNSGDISIQNRQALAIPKPIQPVHHTLFQSSNPLNRDMTTCA